MTSTEWRSALPRGSFAWILVALTMLFTETASAQDQAGSIRGVIYDADFEAPLPAGRVSIVETGQEAVASDLGNYVLQGVAPGTYTLVFFKEGYVRKVQADVVVTDGRLTEVNASLAGDFEDMEEYVVQDILLAGGSAEAALLQLRLDSPAVMDSISAELMSRAGAGDAAGALRLVSGATVKDGKSAVIRGLPDRYVSTQLNGVRLPSSDDDKRAVELDQYPAVVVESVQVSKTFTPDQQGDASGGAVNVALRGIPTESIFNVKFQYSLNTQVAGAGSDFLTYDGGGVGAFGLEGDKRGIQTENIGDNWDGAVGTRPGNAPIDFKLSTGIGGQQELDNGVKIGGFASLFYERDSSYYDNGINDNQWVDTPGAGMVPRTIQGSPTGGDFLTQLYDVTQGVKSVQWGGLGTFGIESENNFLGLTYLYSHTADDKATLAENTRGKEYFFPGYDVNDPTGPGNTSADIDASPWVRLQTLEYTERTNSSLQLNGAHTLPFDAPDIGDAIDFKAPQLDWVASLSNANLDQPDKRQFGSVWRPRSFNPGAPPFIDPFFTDPTYNGFRPAANINLGNLQRIYREIDEDSSQISLNLTLPFEQWGGEEGYLKGGIFSDEVDRAFDQDSFSNFGDSGSSFVGGWEDFWSDVFPDEDHPITESDFDVDYSGEQNIQAFYGMLDLPLTEKWNVIGGARFESTELSVVNDPEALALWFPPGSTSPTALNPGDADVDFEQDSVLPSIGLVYRPVDSVMVRASYSETIARQTFKEVTPIIQQEFLGGPIFIGNPDLGQASLENADLRVDYTPYQGGLVSVSWFGKWVEDPIEYVQRVIDFTYTTPVNYPDGELSGVEVEVRQDLGRFWRSMQGFSVGANATVIDSEVRLPQDEIDNFAQPNIDVPITARDMTDAPEYLYNLYLTYDLPTAGTRASLFYTVQGDTLIAGAGESNGNFVPDIYATEFGTLNLAVSQELSDSFTLQFGAKNLTNPPIQTVYRSSAIGADVLNTKFTRGLEFSLSLSWRISI